MARIEQRVAQNIPGKFYVEWTCIYCDLCVETVPAIFKENKETGCAYVFRQPSSAEEISAAMEAVEGCPTESIGFDGDLHDWSAIPAEQDLQSEKTPKRSMRDFLAKLLGKA